MALNRIVLVTLYAGLGAVLAAECLGEAAPPPAGIPAPHVESRPVAAPAADPAPLAEAILARPLFDPTRRPPPDTATTSVPRAAPIVPPKERLAGIITADHLRVALFIRDPEGKSLALGAGDRLGAWQVAAIYPDRVTLRAGDGSLLIKSLTGTTVPLLVSWLRDWKPAKFHREE